MIRRRAQAYTLCAALLGATAAPALSDPSDDGFPLSTYPMFAEDRGRVAPVVRAVAIGTDGSERRVPAVLLANSEPMQALQTLRKTIAAGPGEAVRLCRAVASRIRASGDSELASQSRLELQTVRVDSVAYLAGEAEPVSRKVHARCSLGPAD